ncbi:conjugal transfer protein TraG N-terminal domain-containing protein [Klebsiella variicola]|uniref:conjugal transfer protein TraG N-terminal domain-containing protein n=1 Tax=Klebsiella variicola TaxID=244366 RepID=UPI002006C131|nr:conjugal transfer protein TraG N-terminal domain-containing protein [Klebsiella variicola]MCK6051094.1 conjugal transfer protein TraG N-terminal domain-containing protein [Klebsiella variicola]
MTTNSYLEYFLTLLGWLVNNNIWEMLTGSGLFVLPLVFRILGEWIRVREEGEDEGNKGLLLIPRLEHVLYGAMIVIIACCMPASQLSLSTLTYDTARASECGYWTPAKPENTGYSTIISSLNGESAAVPVWWVVVHKYAKGVTQGAIAGIPCRPDLRQVRFDIQHTRLSNPALAEEIREFTRDCYSQSLYTWKRENRGVTVDKSTLRDISWIGSNTFLTTKGYYDELQARNLQRHWPWEESRDSGFFGGYQAGGHPYCAEWWTDGTYGLKARILDNITDETRRRLRVVMKSMDVSEADYTEALVRQLVSPRNMTVSQNGQVYVGYGGNVDPTATSALTRTASVAGTALGSLAAFPAFDAMRQALPMVQAIVLMSLYILTPMILVLSGYQFRPVITLTFVMFGLNFLTFWWELARWLDSWMLTALYSSDTHSRMNIAGLQNTSDDIILNLIMGTMFIVLPSVWMGALGWAGVHIGHTMSALMKQATTDAQTAGGKAANKIAK